MLPATYNESTLANFMLAVTRDIAQKLAFTVSEFQESVNDTLIAYGVETIGEATDAAKLRAIARVMAWRTIVEAASGEFDSSTDSGGGSVWQKRQQLQSNAESALKRAEAAARQGGYLIAVSSSSGGGSVSLSVVASY